MLSRLIFSLLLALCCLGGTLPAQVQAASGPARILAGSTLIADVLGELAPQGTDIRVLIPGGACPGHFDLKPSDLELIQGAQAVILHAWQKNMPTMKNLLHAAENDKLAVDALPEPVNPMLPSGQAALTSSVCDVLVRVFPAQAKAIRTATEHRLARIKAVGTALQVMLEPLRTAHIKVLCSVMQAQLVDWAGCEVVARYGRPQDLTPVKLAKLIAVGRENGVTLVVDNIQSGADMGSNMAEELNAKQIALSNFPGAIKDTPTWEQTLRANIRQLMNAAGI
ncbi:metal ABC transporter solute-binding protein, Zn/Mn family [Pseudodesulfovibrio sp.]|uniref:metal ABC transporter solute-binding protein, Zn/Mn family n=1 Tax=unclassified Pseudodesulfovibrio TaxID=2661612 RepID=UPI003B001111